MEGKSKIVRLRLWPVLPPPDGQPQEPRSRCRLYHIIIIDECQDADDTVIRKSIHPMLAAYAGTIAKIGTPGYHKGDFYKAINVNKRRQSNRRARQNHFEYDYRVVSKYNANYAKFIAKEKIRLGEDSEEFQMSYRLKWMLERGMLVTEDDLDYLADPRHAACPVDGTEVRVVVGIDPARSQGQHCCHSHVG